MLKALKVFNHQVNFGKEARLRSTVFQVSEQQAGLKECESMEEKNVIKCWSCQWSITFSPKKYTNRVPQAMYCVFIATITFLLGASKAFNMVSQIASYY